MNFRIRIILAQLSLFASLSPILNNPVVDARKNDSAILITANDGIELEVSQSNTITGNTAMKPLLKRDGA